MLELIQFPWSPYCIVQRRILEFAGARFKLTNIPSTDRSRVWRLTRGRYYGVPIIKDGSEVLFETDNDSQVLAKYLDFKFGLGLFGAEWEGVQSIIWRCIENEVEEMTFKLNDVYWRENVPAAEHVGYIRHKERKFGVGCLDQWRRDQKSLLAELTRRLLPFEEMLYYGPFLLGPELHFIDFDLAGMLDNFLYSGHYRLPAVHNRLQKWHRRMAHIQFEPINREKLRT
jgi:glutathione S-transferase